MINDAHLVPFCEWLGYIFEMIFKQLIFILKDQTKNNGPISLIEDS